jgi:hypothetical protein
MFMFKGIAFWRKFQEKRKGKGNRGKTIKRKSRSKSISLK